MANIKHVGAGMSHDMSPDGRVVFFDQRVHNIPAFFTPAQMQLYKYDVLQGSSVQFSSPFWINPTNYSGMVDLSTAYFGGPILSPDGRHVLYEYVTWHYGAQSQTGEGDRFRTHIIVKDASTGALEWSKENTGKTIVDLLAVSNAGDVFYREGEEIPGTFNFTGLDLSKEGAGKPATHLPVQETDDVWKSAVLDVSPDGSVYSEGYPFERDTLIRSTVDGRILHNLGEYVYAISFSENGRFALYVDAERDNNPDPGDMKVLDLRTGTTQVVSEKFDGIHSIISDDGRFLAFSTARALVEADKNGVDDVYVKDVLTGGISLVSSTQTGAAGNGSSGYVGAYSTIDMSADGRLISFSSTATNLSTSDTNGSLPSIFIAENALYGLPVVVPGPDLHGTGKFAGTPGNERIFGDGDNDTLQLAASRASYTLSKLSGSIIVEGPEGRDTLIDVERLQFADGTLALQEDDVAAQAFRLYRAALGREPDAGGLGFQTAALDAGFSLGAVGKNFISSPEFNAKYGALSNKQFVEQLYLNVLGRAGEPGGTSYHTANLDDGLAREWLLAQFSESPENQANVLPLIRDGIWYT